MLGITEPAVSQYKLRKSETTRSRGDTIQFPKEMIPHIKKAAERIMESWDAHSGDQAEAVYEDMTREIVHLIRILRDAGVICEVHKQQAQHVSDDCHACID